MENIWLRHQAGLKQSPNNVFMVELPPPTPKEIAQMCGEEKHDEPDDEASFSKIIEGYTDLRGSMFIRRNLAECKAKTSEPVEYAMEHFDSVWCGEYCSRCGRRQHCSDPIK